MKLEDLGGLLGDVEDEELNHRKNTEDQDKDEKDLEKDGEEDEINEKKKKKKKLDDEDAITDSHEYLEKLGEVRYIDFAEFAKILSLFNPRTGVEDKISFYFRIFDVNEDKKIDREDLNKIMKMLFGSKLQQDDVKTLGDKIFDEVIQSSDKDYLDHDDVSKILFSTNIEHKCSMHFFQS